MNILFIGDVFGPPGRAAIREYLPGLRRQWAIDLVVANGENAAGGAGLTPALADELLAQGVDVLTGGNHIWDKRELNDYLEEEPRLLRPLNYPPGAPGRGWGLYRTKGGLPVAVLNLHGRVFVSGSLDCPFRAADSALAEIGERTKVILVDFHAEATSEKMAMGWYLDGRVSAVVGTHTHVATADERILPQGTAYQTDVGFTGPHDSIIGVETSLALERFLSGRPVRFEPAKGPGMLSGLVVSVDPVTGRAESVERLVAGG